MSPEEVAADFAVDLAALREGAALIERDGDLLELTGPDRLRLLNGLVTADVKAVAPGSAIGGFFTSGQGKILADFRLLALPESCWLLLPKGAGEAIRSHLEKYKVASRVEILQVENRRLFELRGARAGRVAAEAFELLSDGGEVQGTIFAEGGRFLLLPEAFQPGRPPTLRLRAGSDTELRAVSAKVADLVRVEDGELVFGVDFSIENFPQETGREGAVSYTKGCYLGQEIVARIHYRGGVQRQPRGVRFAAGEPPSAGTALLLEGRPVGRATSVARSPRFGAIGLGLLHQRGSAPGTRLEVEGGGEAEVVALPFGSDQGS
jgi:tRNA-modifying protein YgfZ